MVENLDNLSPSCKTCPLLTPFSVGFMRTMSREMMSGEIEDAENLFVFNAMSEQAGEAMDDFINEMSPDTDFLTLKVEAQKRFGPLMTAAIDQALATFKNDREDLSNKLLESQPGFILCEGPIELDEKTFCGASILAATSEEGLEKQATMRRLNEEFIDSYF